MLPGPVTVVGGGLIGLVSAHYLVERGHPVTVLERSVIGSGASRVNGGWVCPSRSDPLPSAAVVRDGLRSLASPSDATFRMRPRDLPSLAGFLARFLRHSGRSIHARSWDDLDLLNRSTDALADALQQAGLMELYDEGFLILQPDRAAAVEAHDALARTASRGLSPVPERVLGRDELLALEPCLGEAVGAGFRHRGDRWLDPSLLVDTLADSLEERGVDLRPGVAVTGVATSSGGPRVATSEGTVESAYVVLAAGAWSEPLLRGLGVRGVVTPGKGYSLTLHPEHPPRHVLRLADTHLAVTPTARATRLVGIVELGRDPESPDPRAWRRMAEHAAPYLTGVDWAATTDHQVGPRPMTPDGKPLIGLVPGAPGVVVATGHNMLGLSLAPATGRLVADLVESGAAAALPAFDPMRFSKA